MQICGRYGAYICDATDEDVCSIECRDVCLLRHKEALVLSEEQLKQRALSMTLLRRRLGIRVVSGDGLTATVNNGQPQQQQIPFPIVSFADCDLPPQLYANMQMKLLERPSPVQMQAIPCVLARNNVRRDRCGYAGYVDSAQVLTLYVSSCYCSCWWSHRRERARQPHI